MDTLLNINLWIPLGMKSQAEKYRTDKGNCVDFILLEQTLCDNKNFHIPLQE